MNITGIVISAAGEFIANAHVYVMRGTLHGTTTNTRGEYTLTDVQPGELVTISHVGYTGETFTVPAFSSTTPEVHVLEPSTTQLDPFEIVEEVTPPPARPSGMLGLLLLAAVAAATSRT